MRFALLPTLALFLFLPMRAHACIIPFLLPTQDIKDFLEKSPDDFTPDEAARLDEFQKDLEYYNSLKITCMGRDKERDDIHRKIQLLLKEKWR